MAELGATDGIEAARQYSLGAERLQRHVGTGQFQDALQQLRNSGASAEFTDSFQNFALRLGMGAGNELFDSSTYGFNAITRVRTLLEFIHRGSWLGGVAVDLIADDMCKLGLEITSDLEENDEQAIYNEMTALKIWQSLNDCMKWARLYGGALGVVMVDGQSWDEPLDIDRIGHGAFRGILALDRWMVEPTLNTLVTDLGPEVGLPKFYKITGFAPVRQGTLVHHSRCIRFEGIRLPYWQRVAEQLWGVSILERLYDRMVAFDSATTGAAQAVQKSHIRTYKVHNLTTMLSQGGDSYQLLLRHADMMRRFMGVEGMAIIDAQDEFDLTASAGFAGMSDALHQFGQQLAGALQIPLTRLFGMSPAGMSATGESDMRMYFDNIQQLQETNFRIPLQNIIRMIGVSKRIAGIDESLQWIFRPLWQLTEEGKSGVASTDTTSITQAYADGIISRGQALSELRQLSRKTGMWSTITAEDVNAAMEEPPPGFGEMPGMEGGEEQPGQFGVPGSEERMAQPGEQQPGLRPQGPRAPEEGGSRRPPLHVPKARLHLHLGDRLRGIFGRRPKPVADPEVIDLATRRRDAA